MERFRNAYMGIIGQSMEEDLVKMTELLVLEPFISANSVEIHPGTLYRMRNARRPFMLEYFSDGKGNQVSYHYLYAPWNNGLLGALVPESDMSTFEIIEEPQESYEGFLPWQMFHESIDARLEKYCQTGVLPVMRSITYWFDRQRNVRSEETVNPSQLFSGYPWTARVNMAGDDLHSVCIWLPYRSNGDPDKRRASLDLAGELLPDDVLSQCQGCGNWRSYDNCVVFVF